MKSPRAIVKTTGAITVGHVRKFIAELPDEMPFGYHDDGRSDLVTPHCSISVERLVRSEECHGCWDFPNPRDKGVPIERVVVVNDR
jgi:hypothetical protein